MNDASKVLPRPTALLVEDEAVLRAELRTALMRLWPELLIVGEAADGIEAARLLEDTKPDIAFLDIRLPGLSGIEVARMAAHRTHVIFLTAYDEYAISAFNEGAVDYLLKPLDMARLALAVQRVKSRLMQVPADLSALQIQRPAGRLSWIQASCGKQLRLVNVDDVRFFRADAKYTRIATAKFEAYIRTPIKELAPQLDTEKFWQISRSVIVNVAAIDAVKRVDGGVVLRIDGETEWIPVSQTYQHRFRQM